MKKANKFLSLKLNGEKKIRELREKRDYKQFYLNRDANSKIINFNGLENWKYEAARKRINVKELKDIIKRYDSQKKVNGFILYE